MISGKARFAAIFLVAATGLCGPASTTLGSAQETSPQKPARLTFEVAAIHLSKPGTRSGGVKPTPGGDGYVARNMPVKAILAVLYRVPASQIIAGPEWLSTENYDIEARADHPYGLDDLHTMFQNLLADRFNLKFHKEAREGNVYALTVDKSGVKMKEDGTGQDLKVPITPGKDHDYIGTRVPMQYLCFWLGQQLQSDQRPVIDRTGLTGDYDFTLSFAPPLPPDVPRDALPLSLRDRPSIFDALKQQLGLKLEPQRGPVDYYVIDQVERPSEN